MKYITSVQDGHNIKHIVEVEGKNVEVVQCGDKENYGNKSGELSFLTNNCRVTNDLHVRSDSGGSDYTHLAQLVFAIELVRFVIEHLKGEI